MQFTEKQNLFLQKTLQGCSMFLTGKAGTGKSTIVNETIAALKMAGKHVIAVAPTGIAANNINGQTIHSLFRIPPFGVQSFDTCNFINKGGREVLRKATTIVVDEVSMMRPDLLDAMHWTLRKNGLKGLHERQVIFVGDMKQLPPILDDNERSVLLQTYDGETFEYAQIYKRLNVEVIELDEVVRQTDEEFIHNLNFIREGKKSEYFRRFVHTETKGIILAPHNTTVNDYNDKGLNALEGETHTFQASIQGEVKPQDFNFENIVHVKDGAKIMYLVNSQENPLRNGTIGTYVYKNKKHWIKVAGVEYHLKRVCVTKKQYVYNKAADALELQELGSIDQMPIKLAYALSIHKSQGMTFDEVTVDLRRPCFSKGQMYVALSRVRSPAGLRIIVK